MYTLKTILFKGQLLHVLCKPVSFACVCGCAHACVLFTIEMRYSASSTWSNIVALEKQTQLLLIRLVSQIRQIRLTSC